ncbi:PTS transporter subunit EIIB [Actinomyces vulturis]|uniref:PTS transporter subunit EIIB n=1 Tax=Actinomyces vulturis TaxID=1857645 RepID=UPI000830449C|nr:glucose PTS transporter subunit EIIB [Actinomyces vulturis]
MIDLSLLIQGLGGMSNIATLEPCVTRLRTEVHDPSLVDRALLKACGAHGVFAIGPVVQVVVGPNADTIASDLDEELWAAHRDENDDH